MHKCSCSATMQDHISVVFDGIDKHNIFEEVRMELASMPGRPSVKATHILYCITSVRVAPCTALSDLIL